MRSQHVPMTWQEYELLPMKLGWKYEYWDGQTHQLGDLTEKDRKALTAERERWKARVEEVEAIADQQGTEAVLPSLRWR